MKVKLRVSQNRMDEVMKELEKHGIEIDEKADLILSEEETTLEYLPVRDLKGDRIRIAAADIIYIESYGHDVYVHTREGRFDCQDRLYQLEQNLDKKVFIRVSNSAIISRRYLKKIRPALSMKFVLTMADGTLVDVTRSYYTAFKQFMNI